MRILISGGGTGGHIFPAIAIADTINKQAPDTEFLFIGAQDKLEMEKVPQAGYPIEGLWISGFHRQLTIRNLSFPFKLISSLWKARRLVRRFKPDAVVGVGGYASGPTLRVASSMGIPCLIQEQNSYAGVTNRLLAQRVQRICVAYEQMERYFPADKLLLTGNPVRAAIRKSQVSRAEGIRHFELDPEKKTVLMFGGSLGARSMNRAMAEQEELLKANPKVQLIWQVGKLYWEQYRESPIAQLPQVKVVPFIDRMDLAYAAADVVVGRAGALTISELCLVGKPVVLVPSPNVAEDHQTKNAQALAERNAAVLLPDRVAQEGILQVPLDILGDEKRAKELGQQILELAKPNAAETIAAAVLELANQKR